jgi:hypothetical protein
VLSSALRDLRAEPRRPVRAVGRTLPRVSAASGDPHAADGSSDEVGLLASRNIGLERTVSPMAIDWLRPVRGILAPGRNETPLEQIE